jgi:glutaconate CoA-transferase subunit B
VLAPHEESGELELSSLYEGATVEEARAAVGWPLSVREGVACLPAPTSAELDALRALHARTRAAHSRPVRLPA